ncbi:hypothetical protein J6590_041176 [Homalodisca vitripennis]|nr:hypothetical protein J6590_041176 [Homalodisca vitripennis]
MKIKMHLDEGQRRNDDNSAKIMVLQSLIQVAILYEDGIHKLRKEAKEAEEELRKKEKKSERSDVSALVEEIQARRRASNDNFLDNLEKKYSKANETKKSSRTRKSKF